MSMAARPLAAPSLWVGVECTVNRVGDSFEDQCRKNGHSERETDLDLFAGLEPERIRYPFLWEWADRGDGEPFDWTWADARVRALRDRGLEPIAGFVHHGSGPRHTSLVDGAFPEKLARYAEAFAARFPQINDYTPVNEPLTTARFSGLYGFWYPHGRDGQTFVRCLLQQIRGTVLSMAAIRRVNPRARLIQTEDMGRAAGTPTVKYQVDFENERRWLSFDLLCGRVTETHSLYGYLTENGASAEELAWFVSHPCPPDIVGINHYLLSNRFLDERLDLYPPHLHGGNGRDAYADVGAVDTGRADLPTAGSVLEETWARYHLPIAVTEAHVNGPREAQLRWLKEVWSEACRVREKGVDLRAVTVWALLGSFDWNTCCTRNQNFYESGVFDVRASVPRPTALAGMARALSREGNFHHPLLEQPGWWRLPTRAMFAREFRKGDLGPVPGLREPRPVLLTGATGLLGRAFARVAKVRGIPYRILNRAELDIANPESVRAALDQYQPWAVINCAGFARIETAEAERERCYRENVTGPEILADLTAGRGISFLSFSSDMVFDGRREEPYLEDHPVAPVNYYGQTKVEAEQRILHRHPGALIVRSSSFFGPWDEHNFITGVLHRLARGETVGVASDLVVSPTYVPDLANACLDLLVDGASGIVHLANRGSVTWAELATKALGHAAKHPGFEGRLVGAEVEHRPAASVGWRVARPRFSSLGSARANILPSLDEALHRYFNELEVTLPKATASASGGLL